ncbi:MAG: hypothetical protein IJW29_06280 [Clostridia bacterium]|nr:hypothetical protein [Clostridia bacterium]
MMSGERLAQYGCSWIKDNKAAFHKIMHIVHCEVESGNPCVQQGDIVKLAKDRGIDIGEYPGIKRDRNLWPVITRYAVMLRPKLAKALHFRKSKLDKVDLVEIWHAEVNAGTLFFAKDWKDAKHLVEIGDVTAQ